MPTVSTFFGSKCVTKTGAALRAAAPGFVEGPRGELRHRDLGRRSKKLPEPMGSTAGAEVQLLLRS